MSRDLSFCKFHPALKTRFYKPAFFLAYATMSVSVCLSICLSVTEVYWHIIANLGFKFQSNFTAHCGRGKGHLNNNISCYASHC